MITLYHISIILDTYQYFTDIGTSLLDGHSSGIWEKIQAEMVDKYKKNLLMVKILSS